jgi:hypothetical protein
MNVARRSILSRVLDAVPYRERPKGSDTRIERQELWCHDCENYVQFDMDVSLDGNHVLECPNCGHEHCRVVKAGKITDIRWDSRNGLPVFIINPTAVTTTINSTFTSSSTSDVFLYGAWMNITSGTT